MAKQTRYIFVMGGVLSGLGKGIAVSSIARILQGYGYRVSAMKIDPYVNVDAGTMNPTEHGEVFVTHDGLETDQDIGNYERFLEVELSRENYMTTGQVYLSIIKRERNLEYHGKSVQVVPHIPEEVIRRIRKAATVNHADVMLIEIGGTVGEYENLIFLEAARMMHLAEPKAVQFILVSYLPIPGKLGEMKTKPTQHAVRALNSAGIHPDFVLCRAEFPIDKPRKEKLSIFCNMHESDIISAPDVRSVYEVPMNFEEEGLGKKILNKFGLGSDHRDLHEWRTMVSSIKRLRKTVSIAIIGKYFATGDFTLADSYISVIEAIRHASWVNGVTPELTWVNAEDFENSRRALRFLDTFDGIIVPGGFGSRGIEGKIRAIGHARTNRIPFFGLCYGMQLAVVEFARSVVKLRRANTTEVDGQTPFPVIDMLAEQREKLRLRDFGGTMRLGDYRCRLTRGTKAQQAYQSTVIRERHRHRYELNNKYRDRLERAGLTVAGVNPERNLVEIIELSKHPFFVGVQFHPEFKTYPLHPHPLFAAFTSAAKLRSSRRKKSGQPKKLR